MIVEIKTGCHKGIKVCPLESFVKNEITFYKLPLPNGKTRVYNESDVRVIENKYTEHKTYEQKYMELLQKTELLFNKVCAKMDKIKAPYDSNTESARLVNEHCIKVQMGELDYVKSELYNILNPEK